MLISYYKNEYIIKYSIRFYKKQNIYEKIKLCTHFKILLYSRMYTATDFNFIRDKCGTVKASFHTPWEKNDIDKQLKFNQNYFRSTEATPKDYYKTFNVNHGKSMESSLSEDSEFNPERETKFKYTATDMLLLDNLSAPRYTKTNFFDNLINRGIENMKQESSKVHFNSKRTHSHTLQPV